MININDCLEEIPVKRVIKLVQELGADRYVEENDKVIFPTICHNVRAEEASMKLYYYKKNHLFHCYTDCGDSFNLAALFIRRYELLGIDYTFYKDIVLKIVDNDYLMVSKERINKDVYKSIYEDYKQDISTVEFEFYNKKILNIFSNYKAVEWLNEGISEETMQLYDIRFSIDQNKIIIPHFDIDGNLIGIRGRALDEDDLEIGKYMPIKIEGKLYNHPLGFNLYGLNIVKENIKKFKVAIIAEGEKSPLLYNTYFGKENNICVACCGSFVHKHQIDLLLSLGVERIIIAFDKEGTNSEEKEKYYNKIKQMCSRYKNLCQMSFLYDYKNYLDSKDSPLDKGREVFENIIKEENVKV